MHDFLKLQYILPAMETVHQGLFPIRTAFTFVQTPPEVYRSRSVAVDSGRSLNDFRK